MVETCNGPVRKPSAFREHETGFSFKAGYFRFARDPLGKVASPNHIL